MKKTNKSFRLVIKFKDGSIHYNVNKPQKADKRSVANALKELKLSADIVELKNSIKVVFKKQTTQMMSNISKMLHDTAMSVIRKMGG